jgi:hypothetical protein
LFALAANAASSELGPRTPPARVISLPVDLPRHELLMTRASGRAAGHRLDRRRRFLPLARVSSGLADS